MLIKFKYNNFCSFNIQSEFSMEAPSGKIKMRFPDNFSSSKTGYDLLKTAVIVGENAGGKSNFMQSLRFVKSLFTSTNQIQSIRSYVNSSSLLTNPDPVQTFEITLLSKEQQIYRYTVAIDRKGIVEKILRSRINGNPHSLIFLLSIGEIMVSLSAPVVNAKSSQMY